MLIHIWAGIARTSMHIQAFMDGYAQICIIWICICISMHNRCILAYDWLGIRVRVRLRWSSSCFRFSDPASSSLCGFSSDVPKVEATWSLTWPAFFLVAWVVLDTFSAAVSFASLALSFVVLYEVKGLKSKAWGWSSEVWGLKSLC